MYIFNCKKLHVNPYVKSTLPNKSRPSNRRICSRVGPRSEPAMTQEEMCTPTRQLEPKRLQLSSRCESKCAHITQGASPNHECPIKHNEMHISYYKKPCRHVRTCFREGRFLPLKYYSISHPTHAAFIAVRRAFPTTQVLLHITPHTRRVHCCPTLYYKVLPQYYSVLQSTSPVLLCTTKY